MNPTIIGLVGGARVGKNTIGERLAVQHGFWTLAFSEPLYDGLEATLNLAEATTDPEMKDEQIPGLGKSLRELLQGYGDWLRATLGDDILIRRLEERMRTAANYGHDAFAITDVRLVEEIAWIRAHGGAVWWVDRPGAPLVRPHATEDVLALSKQVALPQDVFILNDGSWAELAAKVDVHLEALLTGEFSS